jgi:thioredoxin-like negative regulator of GroEL
MESLIAYFARKERKRLHVVAVDADRHPELAEKLDVTDIPELVLVLERAPVARLVGRATGAEIQALIASTLPRDV